MAYVAGISIVITDLLKIVRLQAQSVSHLHGHKCLETMPLASTSITNRVIKVYQLVDQRSTSTEII